ncbi:MAG: hypothetical protein ACREDE_00760 [Thermoplasmata archaeon]
MGDTPEDQARALHLEVLKLLNRAEEEEGSVGGLEREEVARLLAKVGLPNVSTDATQRTLALLVVNGLARTLTDPEYAWDRGRVVGERIAITTDGKRLLLKELEKVGRVYRPDRRGAPTPQPTYPSFRSGGPWRPRLRPAISASSGSPPGCTSRSLLPRATASATPESSTSAAPPSSSIRC